MNRRHARWPHAVWLLLWCAPLPALAATLGGTVNFPVSDGGYAPRTYGARVRVMGTQLSAAVVEDSVDRSTGTFSLAGVPNGAVTLIMEEPTENNAIGDRFTQDSKRLQLNVSGDVSGLTFTPVFHWQNLPSYPPPYHDPSYDIWQPHFVSDQLGFMSFLNRGVSPNVHELWRTTNGGTSWSRIGEWVHGTATGIPDFVSNLDLLFVDANHGVMTARFGPPNYTPVGVLRTADGGVTWEGIDFPNVPASGSDPGGNGRISIVGYAAIDATHWIACGSENVGTYMGSGTPGYVTIWETSDAGATWRIGLSWREDYGTCSVVSADPSGKAFVFDSPYAFGGNRILAIRDVSGTWTLQPDNNMVANSGYGPADGPMLDGTTWLSGARWVEGGASVVEEGLFRSPDGGASWSKISDALVQYFDFATAWKAFATAGGPAYASYDGGETWRYQAQGGGICCHGDHMYAFARHKAIWQDGGVGDPNGTSDVFRYVEAAAPLLEVLPGTAASDATAKNGSTLVPVLAIRLTSHGMANLVVPHLHFKATGTGNDHTEVNSVGLWWDRNANGTVDGDDVGLSSGTYGSDNGEVVLTLGESTHLSQLNPRQLLLTYDLSPRVRNGVTFRASVTPAQVSAITDDDESTAVEATAPGGAVLVGGTITAVAQVPIAPTIPAQLASEWVSFAYTVPAFTDPDGGELSYTFSGLPSWLSVCYPLSNPRYLCGRPPYTESSASAERSYNIGVTAADPDTNEATASFVLRVVNVNRPPAPTGSVPEQVLKEGLSYGYTVPGFSDPDGDTLSYTFQDLPPWLTVSHPETNARYLAGKAPFTEASPGTDRSYTVKLVATDSSGASAERSFVLRVTDNQAPVAPASIPGQLVNEYTSYGYTLPQFQDADDSQLQYFYGGLPSWLTVCYPATNARYLCGRPPYTESTLQANKTYVIVVTARDPAFQSAIKTFSLTVVNANRLPVAPAVIPAQTATEGVSFGYTVPAFSDPDGDALSYTFSGLPAWLTVSYPATNSRYVSGKPPFTEATPGNPQVYTVTVIATDAGGSATSKSFSLSVLDAS